MKKINVLGAMSGTSLDAVDFAFCQIVINKKKILKVNLKDHFSTKLPKALNKKIFLGVSGGLSVPEMVELHFELGKFYSKLLSKYKKISQVDLVGIHGQTVYHNQGKSTFQICEPSFVSHKLNLPVVSDFRSKHIAVGGLGAPIACYFHKFLFDKLKLKCVAFQNIGGIANVTWLTKAKMMSFDTGPGNMLIDGYMKTFKKDFDRGGKFSLSGKASDKMVNEYLKLFKKKNYGREDFGDHFLKKILLDLKGFDSKDIAATLCELTVKSIVKSYKLLPKVPQTIVLCGGGAKNNYFVNGISKNFKNTSVMSSDRIGWPVHLIEPAAIAYLSALRYFGIKVPVAVSHTKSTPALLGKLVI